MDLIYCRFCAELKTPEKLINLSNDRVKFNEVLQILYFLNASYIDISIENVKLHKTICLLCYESLNKAYDFLTKVRDAQISLINFTNNSDSDDDRTPLADLLEIRYAENDIIVKETICERLKTEIAIKVEPKEELLLDDSIGHVDDTNISEKSVNGQHNLNNAVYNSSKLKILERDLSEIRKKVVNNWYEYPWICAICNMEFIDVTALRSHTRAVHRKCFASMCIDCRSVVKLDDFQGFINHVKEHRETLRLLCHYCNEACDSQNTLDHHISQHFETQKPQCPRCGESFDDSGSMKAHLQEFAKRRRKRNQAPTAEELTCQLCRKLYKNANSLRDHQKLHAEGRRRDYTCDRCGKAYFTKGSLTAHIRAHEQLRPHACRICARAFPFAHMLRRHVQVHSADKPFACDTCGRGFRLRGQLRAHAIVHTDRKPFACRFCAKAFRFKQIRSNHELQHTGAKPYACRLCALEFTNWSNFNKHMKRRHGQDTSKKRITPQGVFPVDPLTGQLVQDRDPRATAEWKSRIMVPAKRGKKRAREQ